MRVAAVFFKEPTTIHFIKEIGRNIELAPTSVKNYVEELKKENLVISVKAKPFPALMANQKAKEFLFEKRIYNLYSLKETILQLEAKYTPQAMILYGPYAKGEDTEASAIDILILTKSKDSIPLKELEDKLKRKLHLVLTDSLSKLDKPLLLAIKNGTLLQGVWP